MAVAWYPDESVVLALHTELVAMDPVDRKHRRLMRHGRERLIGALDACRPPPTPHEAEALRVAACLMQEINKRHPFDAANKRTALAVGALILERNGLHLSPPPYEAKAHMLAIREGRATPEATREWLERWTKNKNP